MAKKKGLEEEALLDLTDDETPQEEDTIAEPEKENPAPEEGARVDITADGYRKMASTPEDQLNLVQGIRVAAIEQAVANNDALDLATSEGLKDLLKDTAQTASSIMRANAEAQKADNSELIQLLAKNSLGLEKKRSDTSVASEEMGSNPIADASPTFGSNVKEIETVLETEIVDYDDIMAEDKDKK